MPVTGRKGEAAIDWWTLVHFSCGCVLGLLPLGWAWAVALIVGYEVVEGGLRRIKVRDDGLFEYESWPNILIDVVVGLAGFSILHLAVFPFMPDWLPWSLE